MARSENRRAGKAAVSPKETPVATIRRMAEHRTRRRGKELEDALYDATLAELAAVGYGGLTMEGIAARARTGKAALYRRWTKSCLLDQRRYRAALPVRARAAIPSMVSPP